MMSIIDAAGACGAEFGRQYIDPKMTRGVVVLDGKWGGWIWKCGGRDSFQSAGWEFSSIEEAAKHFLNHEIGRRTMRRAGIEWRMISETPAATSTVQQREFEHADH